MIRDLWPAWNAWRGHCSRCPVCREDAFAHDCPQPPPSSAPVLFARAEAELGRCVEGVRDRIDRFQRAGGQLQRVQEPARSWKELLALAPRRGLESERGRMMAAALTARWPDTHVLIACDADHSLAGALSAETAPHPHVMHLGSLGRPSGVGTALLVVAGLLWAPNGGLEVPVPIEGSGWYERVGMTDEGRGYEWSARTFRRINQAVSGLQLLESVTSWDTSGPGRR